MNQIIPATAEHVEYLASNLRRVDAEEIQASTDMDAHTVLMMSLALSVECFTWMHDGEVACVFGVAPDSENPGAGCPWMIGTPHMYRDRRFFLKTSRRVVDRWTEMFPLLENYVHPANAPSIRWLEWCGFKFDEPEPFGANDQLFIPFYKEA